MEPVTPTLPDDDVAAIDRLGAIYKELSSELSKMIIGQQRVVELLSIALFSRGHALLMGVPGLAKTLMVSSVAKTLDLSFNRIQFTPDLMPADITGTDIIQDDSAGGKRQFEFIKGARVRQHRAGGRNQPRPRQNPVRPAGGHAGAPRHRHGPHLHPAPPLFSCLPPKTPLNRKAPTPCRKPSWTASCS